MPFIDRRALVAALPLIGLAACNKGASGGPVPDDMSRGDPKAKVTVIEYASVACPVCGKWYREVFPAFKAKYIDTNKINFITREMLVGGDTEVTTAAAGFLTARCAGKDKYFTVVDAIFKQQDALFQDPHATLLSIAKSVGMSESQFNTCINDDKALLALNNRVDSYVKNDNVDGTPTFVVNGKALSTGYHPLSDLDAAIAAAQAAK